MPAVKKRLTRKWRFEVDTGPEGAPSWTLVKGMNTIELTLDGNKVDSSDFDSEGWEDSDTTFRKWSVSLKGFDGYTGPDNAQVDDPGQAHLRTKGLLTGSEAKVSVRFYRSDTSKGYTGIATANYTGAAGEVKGLDPFGCELDGSGVLSPVTV